MGRKNVVAGLEIGHTKITLAAGEARAGAFYPFGMVKTPCPEGVRNGAVINLDNVSEAITAALDKMGRGKERAINSVFVNISGLGLDAQITTSVVTLPHRGCEITQKNINDLTEACKIISVSIDSEPLYIAPLEYMIDGQGGIKNPLGLCGNKMEGRFLVVSAPFNHVQNIIKAVNFAGLEVEEVVLTAMANPHSALNEEEKRDGALMIDLKTDLTEVYIFRGGSLLFFKNIPKGQRGITEEIASKLNVSLDTAEELKIKYGFLTSSSHEGDPRRGETIPMGWMGKDQNIGRGELNDIVIRQEEELLSLISESVKEARGLNTIIKKGAIITGGVTGMEGFLEWAQARLGFPVRQGLPPGAEEAYVTCMGLAGYGAKKAVDTGMNRKSGLLNRVFQRTGEILSDYF